MGQSAMPDTTATRRYLHRDPSEESDPSSSEVAPGAQGVPSEDGLDPLESNEDDEQRGPVTMDQIQRQLNVLQRQMVHNFRTLHDAQQDTNRRLDELRADTNRRFEDTNRRFEDNNRRFDEHDNTLRELKAQVSQLQVREANKGATYINSPIQPVGRRDGTPIPTELSDRYKHVHEFLRLKRPNNWQVLAELIRFYGSESWPTWGLLSLSFKDEDESDAEEPLIEHDSLEMAISWAPEIALHDLARHIGLDLDRIMVNVEAYELRQRRPDYTKRTTAAELPPSKRERLETPQRQILPRADPTRKTASSDALSGEIGWDTRATEDRTPESQKPRLGNATRYRQPTLSPTSVATSDAQLPTRTKQ